MNSMSAWNQGRESFVRGLTKEDQAIFPWHPSGLGLESTFFPLDTDVVHVPVIICYVGVFFCENSQWETTKGNLASLFGSFKSTYILSESKMIIQCFPNVIVAREEKQMYV